MKLIKLNEQHYIIVDDFDIYKEDFVYYKSVNNSLNPPKNGIYKVEKITNKIIQFYNNEGLVDVSSCKKITHSTQPLEIIATKYKGSVAVEEMKGFDKIKPLPMSEVEEAIYGYGVEKIKKEYNQGNNKDAFTQGIEQGIEIGFNTHKELVKDKLFTIKDMKLMFGLGGKTNLTYIDLELSKDYSGLKWDGSEKTYDLKDKINLIITEMKKSFPDFELEGHLLAQGDSIEDRYYISTFIMEEIKKYIESRLTELNEELKVYWMSEEYYENRKAKIEELELMLCSLNVA